MTGVTADFVLQWKDNQIDLKQGLDAVRGNVLSVVFDTVTVGKLIEFQYDFELVEGAKAWTFDYTAKLKEDCRILIKEMQNETQFAATIDKCINEVSNNNDAEMHSNVFKNLVYVRHFLRRFGILTFIALNVLEARKEVYKRIDDVKVGKEEQLKRLKELLRDSTNILLNLDVAPPSPVIVPPTV